MGGTIGKAPSSLHLCPQQPECHTALFQGHLVWPVLGTVAKSVDQAGTRTPALQPLEPHTHCWCWERGRTHQECFVVEQTDVLGTAEAKAGVDVARGGRDIRELQGQVAVAVESHGPSHLQEGDHEGPRPRPGGGAAGQGGGGLTSRSAVQPELMPVVFSLLRSTYLP